MINVLLQMVPPTLSNTLFVTGFPPLVVAPGAGQPLKMPLI